MSSSEWMDDSVCRSVDPEIWFPEKGGDWTLAGKAKKICAACPAQEPCLEYALQNRFGYGIFGGLSAPQRRKLTDQSEAA